MVNWLQRNRIRLIKLGLITFFVWSWVSGMTDIDWMVTDLYWDMWNSQQEFYTFAPGFTMLWWWAYIYTIMRVVVGSGGLGVMVYRELFER